MSIQTDTKILILIGLVLYVANANNLCVDNYNTCNPASNDPCCNRTRLCKWNNRYNSFRCSETDLLERSCKYTADCLKISHAICLENKCVCKPKYVSHKNNLTCLPTLGEFCHSYDQCAPEKSFCSNGRCRCVDFYDQDIDICKPSLLGFFCNNDGDCDKIKYAECSSDKKCTCKIDYVQTESTKCQPLLEAVCMEKTECFADNSTCTDSRCQCEKDFISQSFDKCVPNFLELSCKIGEEECREAELLSSTRDSKFFCHSNYVAVNNICAPLLNELCTKTESCMIDNSECINFKCHCSEHYSMESNNRCLPELLFGKCKYNIECGRIKNSECVGNRCLCKKNYLGVNQRECVLSIGGSCYSDIDCSIDNSVCINSTCQCMPDYDLTSSHECEPVKYKYCQSDNDCADSPHSECGRNKLCVCKTNFIAINGTRLCAPLLEGFCSRSAECIIDNSFCFLKKCRCRKYYIRQWGNDTYQCNRISLGYTCRNINDCESIKNATCSNNVCSCQTNTYALNELVCASKIDGFCSTNEDCHFNNSHCYFDKCQCRPGYSAVSSNQCVPKSNTFHCNIDLECGDPWRAKCSAKHYCKCVKSAVQYNNATCLPLIGGLCWKDEQCAVAGTLCNDFHCRCMINLKAVADNLCLAENVVYE